MEKITIEFEINEAGELITSQQFDKRINLKLYCMMLRSLADSSVKLASVAAQRVGIEKIDQLTIGEAADIFEEEILKKGACLTPKTKRDEKIR